MPLKQRTVHYSFKGDQLLTVAEETFMRWAGRRNDVNIEAIGRAGELADIGGGVLAQEEKFNAGELEGTRFTHVTRNDGGIYRAEITAVRKGSKGWIQTDVHVPRENAQFSPPAIPRYLLDVSDEKNVHLFDGSSQGVFSPAPRVRRIDDVGALLDEVINHPGRLNPALIAGSSHNVPLGAWSEALEKRILRSSVGLSTLWLLDAEATREFNALVRDEYEVKPNSVHLFAPHTDTDSPGNPHSHRYFSRRDLVEDQKFTSRRIYHLARSIALKVPIPPALTEATRYLRQASTDRVVASFTPTTSLRQRVASKRVEQQVLFGLPEQQGEQFELDFSSQDFPPQAPSSSTAVEETSSDLAAYEENVPLPLKEDSSSKQAGKSLDDAPKFQATEEVTASSVSTEPHGPALDQVLATFAEMIGLSVTVEEINEEFLFSLFELAERGVKAEQTIAKLRSTRDELNEAEQARDDAEEVTGGLLEEIDSYAADAMRDRALASRMWLLLKEQGNEFNDWTDPTEEYPASIEQILRRMDEFEYVEFTGYAKVAVKLDERDNASSIARNCWQFIIALEQYAKQWKEGHTSVDTFLKNAVTPANQTLHAPSETKDVRQTEKYNKERNLRVPTEVNSSGYEYMYAHYRLSHSTGKAARLHYLDDMANTKKIYIGHIGSHLLSRMTT